MMPGTETALAILVILVVGLAFAVVAARRK